MVTIVTRVVGVLLALLGLALTAAGVWFATQLGGSGTAVFTARPAPDQPVLISPEVLNRVDADVELTATPSDGGRVWMALANPSDATAVLGDARRSEVTGVEVRDWALLTTTRGAAQAPVLGTADLWRQQDDAAGPVTLTVRQDQAPESVVVSATEGSLESLTLTVTDKTWFVEAVVAALVGLFLVLAGLVALWPRHRHRRPTPAAPPTGGEHDAAEPEPRPEPEPETETAADPDPEPAPTPEQEAAR